VARKRAISADDLLAIMKLAKEVGELPLEVPEFEFDDLDLTIDLSSFSAPLVVKAAPAEVSTLQVSGTHPICIRVPVRVIRSFKRKAAATGSNYQTLMNRALASAVKDYV
jgi:predicted DNA binding CopG/RHH family protein